MKLCLFLLRHVCFQSSMAKLAIPWVRNISCYLLTQVKQLEFCPAQLQDKDDFVILMKETHFK